MVISSFYLTLAFSSLRRRPHRHRHPDGLVDGVIAIISPLLSLRRRRPTDTVILAVDRRGHRHPGGLVDGGIAIISPLFRSRHAAVDRRTPSSCGRPTRAPSSWRSRSRGYSHHLALVFRSRYAAVDRRTPSSLRPTDAGTVILAVSFTGSRPGAALVPPWLRHRSTTRVSSSSLPYHSGMSPSSPRAALGAPLLNNAGFVVFLAVS